MTFVPSTYPNLVSEPSTTQVRLFRKYDGSRTDFDVVIVGSGMGGGVLADNLADRVGEEKRILVIEAGSYLFPTHVYNLCRFPNGQLAKHFECTTFHQPSDSHMGSQHYIHEKPQLNFGGRSIFWSGLIPTIQEWELAFFPPQVRADLLASGLSTAGMHMNESKTMGTTAQRIVHRLRQSPLSGDFDIRETPRALHQPYLMPNGQLAGEYFLVPTGVFNTAELLINQRGVTSDHAHGGTPGLHLLLNHFVEDVQSVQGGGFELVVRDVLGGGLRRFQAGTVVLAGGSIESPKLLRRSSSLFNALPDSVRSLVGKGLTDHPTTDWIRTLATHVGDVPIPRNSHAKIVFYSIGRRESGDIVYPFNVEMNINHEYWHLRENDPTAPDTRIEMSGPSIVELKFSFGNFLEDDNQIYPAPAYGYVPHLSFHNLKWTSHLTGSRFPALAGWQKSDTEVWALLNDIANQIFSEFSENGTPSRPKEPEPPHREIWFGQDGRGFGNGTVHHAVGTLRMPHLASYDNATWLPSVVDSNLRVIGTDNLYVCDMSVMPFSSAANPVRTLVALALRMSDHLV